MLMDGATVLFTRFGPQIAENTREPHRTFPRQTPVGSDLRKMRAMTAVVNTRQNDEYFMRLALKQARLAEEAGDVPVGAVIILSASADRSSASIGPRQMFPGRLADCPGQNARFFTIIGQAHNQIELLKDPTAHAEMIAITQAAGALGDWRLIHTALYVTKEPCPMCAGAITLARIPKVIVGVRDPQNAGVLTADEIIYGVMEEECRNLLQSFFQALRPERTE